MLVVDGFDTVLSESSSRGNQHKFYRDGYWVKLDNQNCSEGLAEDFVSNFESCIYDFPYVVYKSEQIEYNDIIYNGCVCANMYNRADTIFISLRHILKESDIPLSILTSCENIEVNIDNLVKTLYDIVGINLLPYFGRLLLLDCLILNEDRHIMNLWVVKCISDGRFYEASCFDNGSSLFCVNWTYRRRKSFEENIKSAKSVARPFSKFYDKQVDALIALGVKPLVINKVKLDYFLSSYHNSFYSDSMNELVRSVLINRLSYYSGRGVYTFV